MNPYEPTTNIGYEAGPAPSGISGNPAARALVAIYGAFFAALSLAGFVMAVFDEEQVLLNAGWLAISALTCYGVFALAFPSLRKAFLAPIWPWFAASLPILTVVEIASDLSTVPELVDEVGLLLASLVMLIVVLVIVGPAIVFNAMLCRRLRQMR